MDKKITVYFGDSTNNMTNQYAANIPQMKRLVESLGVQSLYVVRQVHGINYRLVNEVEDGAHLLNCEADILVTNKKNTAVGIFTADCVPLLLYAPDKEVIAAVHAGWKGSVNGVAAKAVEILVAEFGIDPMQLKVFIGPCAHFTCYEVKDDVIQQVKQTPYERLTLYKSTVHKNVMLCDLVELNIRFLLAAGCKFSNIDRRESVCTVCSSGYHSVRRDSKDIGRQISLIALR